MNNDFDKALLIPIGMLAIMALGGMFSFGVADEDGRPEFRFKR